MERSKPNIIITGTPGVGKTSHCEALVQDPTLKHLSINQVVKEKGFHEGWDEKLQTYVVDEDKLLDAIESEVQQGGVIIDWHACDLFPTAWVDLVVVLRAESAPLYDRLKARNYGEAKLQENIDAEIMEVVADEARQSYEAETVVELQSNTVEDLQSNVDRIQSWISDWERDHHLED